LTHTAGFDETINLSSEKWPETGELESWEDVFIPPIVRKPGTVKSYSNFGMALAGYIVQTMSGQPFTQYVEEHITRPLGMEQSGFRLTDEMKSNLAQTYDSKGRLLPSLGIRSLYVPSSTFASTGRDMGKFMRALLNGGELASKRVMKPETLTLMTDVQATYEPQLGGMSYGFYTTIRKGLKVWEHGGDINGWHSGLWLIPEDHVGVFISINSEDLNFREEFINAFMNRFFLATVPVNASLDVMAVHPEGLLATKYEGTYITTRYSEASIIKIGSVFDDSLKFRLKREDEDTLTLRNRDGVEFGFIRTAGGLWTSNDSAFAARETADGFFLQFADSPTVDFRKMGWHEDEYLHIGAQSLLCLSLLVSGVYGAVICFRKRKLVPFLPAVASWFNLVFVAGFAALSVLDFGNSAWTLLRVLLALPVAAVLVTIGAVVTTIARRGRIGTGSKLSKWIYVSTIVLQFAFAWNLEYWNLFGWSGMV